MQTPANGFESVRLPFSERIKFLYKNITLNPRTTTYVVLILLHCTTQAVLQSITISADEYASVTVHKVFNEADIQPTFAFIDNSILRVCEGIPLRHSDYCWSIAGPGLQFNRSMSGSLASREIVHDEFDLFERDDGVVESDDDDDTASVASDDSHDSDLDDSDDEDQGRQAISPPDPHNGKKDDHHLTQTESSTQADTSTLTSSSIGSSSTQATSSVQTRASTSTSLAQQTNSAPQANAPTSTTLSSSSPRQTSVSEDDEDSDDEDSDDEDDDTVAQEKRDDFSGKLTNVRVQDVLSESNDNTRLSTRCVRSLSYPEIVLQNAKKEGFVFLAFQLWLLIISIVTIVNESSSHLMTMLSTHVMSSGWSAFSVYSTQRLNDHYRTLVVEEACEGVDLLPGVWANRLKVQIPILILNLIVLSGLLAVSIPLLKDFACRTFKGFGASEKMDRGYKLILMFSAFLQMLAFFVVVSSALWVDTFFSSVIGRVENHKVAYQAVFILICIIAIPWVVLGWIAIRREKCGLTFGFLTMGLAILIAWVFMFASVVYRWITQTFPFFAAMTITTFALLFATMIVTIACRINFGKGLPQYLMMDDSNNITPFVPTPIIQGRNRDDVRSVSVLSRDQPSYDSVAEKVYDLYGDGRSYADSEDKSAHNPNVHQPAEQPGPTALTPPPKAVPHLANRSSFARARQSFMTMLSTSTYIPQTPMPQPRGTDSWQNFSDYYPFPAHLQVPQANYVPMSPGAQASDSAASSCLSSLRMEGDSGYDSASISQTELELGSEVSGPASARVSHLSQTRSVLDTHHTNSSSSWV